MALQALVPHVQVDEISSMRTEWRALIDDIVKEYGDSERNVIAAFVSCAKGDEDVAAEGYEHYVRTIAKKPPAIDRALLDNIFTQPCGAPSPCVVALEDGFGNIARSKTGAPIVAMFDHMKGDEDSWIAQTHMAFMCARRHIGENELPEIMLVLDLTSMTGNDGSFSTKFLKYVAAFPRNYEVHFCGASKAAAVGASLLGKFIGHSVIHVSTQFEKLTSRISRENMIPKWDPDGAFDFDCDRYRRYLEDHMPSK